MQTQEDFADSREEIITDFFTQPWKPEIKTKDIPNWVWKIYFEWDCEKGSDVLVEWGFLSNNWTPKVNMVSDRIKFLEMREQGYNVNMY